MTLATLDCVNIEKASAVGREVGGFVGVNVGFTVGYLVGSTVGLSVGSELGKSELWFTSQFTCTDKYTAQRKTAV